MFYDPVDIIFFAAYNFEREESSEGVTPCYPPLLPYMAYITWGALVVHTCIKLYRNHLHDQLGLSNVFSSNYAGCCPCWIENDQIELVITCILYFHALAPHTYTYIVVNYIYMHVYMHMYMYMHALTKTVTCVAAIGKFNMGGRGLISCCMSCRLTVSEFHVALIHYHTWALVSE